MGHMVWHHEGMRARHACGACKSTPTHGLNGVAATLLELQSSKRWWGAMRRSWRCGLSFIFCMHSGVSAAQNTEDWARKLAFKLAHSSVMCVGEGCGSEGGQRAEACKLQLKTEGQTQGEVREDDEVGRG